MIYWVLWVSVKIKDIAITFIIKPCYSLYALKLKIPQVRIPSKAFQLHKTQQKNPFSRDRRKGIF